MIPTVLLLGCVVGVVTCRRPSTAFVAVLGLAIVWAILVAATADANLLGGFVLGIGNAAVGALFGIAVGRLALTLTRRPAS